ncbi:hypothetical protein ES703_113770 [subsurface metagenome]
MNPMSKKFISLFLAFSLVMLSANLFAKERRGAKLIIQRKSDQVKNTRLKDTPWETSMTGIRGELIAVKPNSLLLLDTEGKDVSVDIADIKVITIVWKKSKALLGGAIGFGAGALLAPFLFSFLFPAFHEEYGVPGILLIEMPVGSLIGAITGALIGGNAGRDKIIQIEGMTDLEIQEALDKLRKKARIRDYK